MTKKDIATYLVGVLLLGGIATGVANAADTTTTGSITIPGLAGCLSNNGTLSNVKFSDVAPSSCSNGKGVAWGLQGPRGLDGAPGLQGVRGPEGKGACAIWNEDNSNDQLDCTTAYGRSQFINRMRGVNGAPGLQGLRGATGDAGRDGVANAGFAPGVTSNFTSDSNKLATAIAPCGANQVVLSGGYSMTNSTNSGFPVAVVNGPVQVNGVWGWQVTMRVPSENSKVGRTDFNVSVVCADIPSN